MSERVQTSGEELANAISHGLGFVAAIVGTPILIVTAVKTGGTAGVIGASVFAATMALLYLTSSVYHALPKGQAKRVFKLLDHSAIYLLIAGSYTPFTLGVLRGPLGWTLLGIVWGLAIGGILIKALGALKCEKISTFIYLAMGWLVLIAIKPLWENMPTVGLAWLVAGGVAYSVGVIFFMTDRRYAYGHFVWHLFVLAGTGCHFVAVWRYAG
ncbi:MAG: hemolysin III family protein [Verrucomicrobiae bacterium]|nr:hemolysin III family protein [Verrucomicrobiae bacterium]